VGVDPTAAVDAASLNVGCHPSVHLVQADILALPFRDGAFDLVYSIGVLHHTPDPRAAFARVAAMVRKGGQCAVYVSHPDWRWPDTFGWYTPAYQRKLRYPKVLGWFRAAGFMDVEVFDEPIRLRRVKAG